MLERNDTLENLAVAEHDAEHAHEPTGDLVDVKCGECGETPTFERESGPSVQTCPDCGANIDVPAAEE